MNPFATNKAKNSSENKLDEAHEFRDWACYNIHIKKHAPFWSKVGESLGFINKIVPDNSRFVFILSCFLGSCWVVADNSQAESIFGLGISSSAPCQLIALIGVLVIILGSLSGNWCDLWVLISHFTGFSVSIQNVKLMLVLKITTLCSSVLVTKLFFQLETGITQFEVGSKIGIPV
jgi:hypothetical protein